MARFGVGASSGTRATTGNAPPVYPSNGGGGPGVLGSAIRPSAAAGEISDLTAGRITLGMVEILVVGLVGFYIWTRSAQGGG